MTHPFHPLSGQRLERVTVRHGWHEERVCYRDGKRLASLPLRWTDLAAADLFVAVSAGRSWFQPADLLRLADRIEILRNEQAASGGPADA